MRAVLLLLIALSLLPAGCQQGGIVEGVVYHKMVTGRKEERIYTIVVRNELTNNGEPSISVGAGEEEIKACFPLSEGNLVVDDMSEKQIEEFYTRIDYNVSIHVISGNRYKYYRGCRTDRETFNRLMVGTKVKLETKPTPRGPWIVSIVGSSDN